MLRLIRWAKVERKQNLQNIIFKLKDFVEEIVQ